jgi:hypothetical protein
VDGANRLKEDLLLDRRPPSDGYNSPPLPASQRFSQFHLNSFGLAVFPRRIIRMTSGSGVIAVMKVDRSGKYVSTGGSLADVRYRDEKSVRRVCLNSGKPRPALNLQQEIP